AKGVVLSHETIYDRICAANEALRLGPGDRVVWLLSMAYHFTVSIVGYLTCGAAVVLPADHFAAATLGAARRHGATMIYASPAHRLRLEDVGQGPGLGEILLAGKGFLDAYYEPWRPRGAVMPDGWFRTGDVGELDADGCLFLRGRVKDMINVLGQKFFPQEVE